MHKSPRYAVAVPEVALPSVGLPFSRWTGVPSTDPIPLVPGVVFEGTALANWLITTLEYGLTMVGALVADKLSLVIRAELMTRDRGAGCLGGYVGIGKLWTA